MLYDGNTYISGSDSDCTRLIEEIGRVDFIIAHHAKFELQWLYRLGVKPGSILFFDTLLAEYCIAGNRRWHLDLDTIAKRYGFGGKIHLVKKMIEAGICPSEIPQDRLLDYCQTDCRETYLVFLEQRKKLEELHLWEVFFTHCLTCGILAEVEQYGMFPDREAVQETYLKERVDQNKLTARIHELSGGINPNSPKQIGEFLYDKLGFEEVTDRSGEPIKTETGARSTAEPTILLLEPKTPEQKEFLEVFKEYIPTKRRLATLKKLSECTRNDDRIKFNFNQSVTATHRLSCNGKEPYKVQGQNIDRDFKRLFRAYNPEWVLAEADKAKIEFAVAGFLTQDPQIQKDIQDHFDVHRYTASIILKKAFDEISKVERADKKPHTFKPLFLGTSGTRDERRYYEAFKKKYNVCYKVQKDWLYKVIQDEQLRLLSGLIMYWPDVEMYESGYVKRQSEIANYPIQSLAGELWRIALIGLWYMMKEREMEGYIVNLIHDSIVCEIPRGERDLWERLVKWAFTSWVFEYLERVYNINFNLPLAITYNIDRFWAQGKEEEYEQRSGKGVSAAA